MVKNPTANAGDGIDVGSIPRLGKSPGEGDGNTFQYCYFLFLFFGLVWFIKLYLSTDAGG